MFSTLTQEIVNRETELSAVALRPPTIPLFSPLSNSEPMDPLHTTFTAPLKILLVDDEPNTVQLVRKILQADGHTVYEAADGLQAIEVFEAAQPDLDLLDVVIPKLDGLGVLQEIRRRDRMDVVIMISALTSEQLAVKSMLGGADDYISKPFT